MALLFLIGHFVLFLILSLIFNFKRLDMSIGFKVTLSFLEAISSYLLISTIFLYEFIAILWVWILHLFLLMPAAVAVAYFYREINENWDWVLENIKNNVLIFLKFLLPFYVFLIIFQNQNLTVQVVLSVSITFALFSIAYWVRRKLADKINFWWINMKNGSMTVLAIWITLGVIAAALLFFWHPINSLTEVLYLSNHISFWTFLFNPLEYTADLHTAFPLYTQFGGLVFIPILLGTIFPLSNYRKHVQVIDISVAYGTKPIDRTDKDI